MDSPFLTVSRAVKKCTVPGKAYTVYVDGTVTESTSIEIPENINVTVKSLTAGSTSESAIDPTATIAAESSATIANMITVNSGATLTMTGITLEGNKKGRGITVTNGTCTLTDCIITDHEVYNGAGIYIDGGTVTINNTQIANCTATGNGGGIYVTGAASKLTMNSGEFNNNTAEKFFGGGVYVNGGTFTMSGTAEISGNSAIYGGGVCVDGGKVLVTGGTIGGDNVYDATKNSDYKKNMGNSATGSSANGGGVYVLGGTFTMSAGTISSNSATQDGGGVYVYAGEFTISGTAKISCNTAASGGGGVYMSGGTFEMKAGTISGNTAFSGGGVHVSAGTVTMSGGKISGNAAVVAINGTTDLNGGGVYVVNEDSEFTMNGGTIGGSVVYNAAETDKTDMGNYASWDGGGVYVSNCGTFTMNNGSITGNTSDTNGGGIYVNNRDRIYSSDTYDGTVIMNGGSITGNKSPSGGGVYLYFGTFKMSGTPVITGNTLLDGKTALNMYLCWNDKIIVTGALNTGASVYITRDAGSSSPSFTSGFNAGSSQSVFFPDDPETYKITVSDGGEACFYKK